MRAVRDAGREDPAANGITPAVDVVIPAVKTAPTVSVVIPALNEEECIDWVLERIPSWVDEVVLVDGLSTDTTELVARLARPDVVVVHQHERGKGAALRAGFEAASGDIVAMIDADGSTDPRELGCFVEALMAGADFVKGSRHVEGGGSVDFTALRRAGNRGFVVLVNLLYRSRFTDLCYGYCAFWRHCLDDLALTADGFEIETQLVLNAVKAGLRIQEVPSFELPRRAGSSNLSAFRDGRRVLRMIVRHRVAREYGLNESGLRISLLELERPSVNSEEWLPAGQDRRRGNRRKLAREAAGYTGPERRDCERRKQLRATATVYVAAGLRSETEAIPVGVRRLRDTIDGAGDLEPTTSSVSGAATATAGATSGIASRRKGFEAGDPRVPKAFRRASLTTPE